MSDSPTLPDYVLPAYVPPARSLKRGTASSINKAQPKKEGTLTRSAAGQLFRVPYGEVRLAGRDLVDPLQYGGDLILTVEWGFGECEGVQALYVNGQALPGGVTVTHYTGTDTQTADPTLQAAKPGFNDAFPGKCYSVLVFPPGLGIPGFPFTRQIEAVLRGRKCYDPRTSTTVWTKNPALFLNDWITSTRYGPGQTVYGIDACADRCDEILDAIEARCEAGIVLESGQSREAILDLLSTYAECLWVDDADGVLLVPDAPYTFTRASEATYWDKDGLLKTAAVDEPRFHYDPLTGEFLGLLEEGAATNILRHSQDYTNAVWTKFNCSIVPNATTGPDGNLTASKLVEDTTPSTQHRIYQSFSVLDGEYWVASFYAKAGERIQITAIFSTYSIWEPVTPAIQFNLSSGTHTTQPNIEAGMEYVGDGWYRCWMKILAVANGGSIYNLFLVGSSGSITYDGDGTSGAYIDASQLEENQLTSYIPTTTAAVTRAADINGGNLGAIRRNEILEKSVKMTGAGLADVPSVINVTWRKPSGTADPWSDEPTTAKLPGVDTGEVPEIVSEIRLPGITRETEAYRKALGRLRRLNYPGRYSFQLFDVGIRYQRGDVVRLPDIRGLVERLVRILSIEMVALGIYQVTAEHYDAAMYPDDVIASSETNVPVGGVVPFVGAEVPGGWSVFSLADGLYLKGLGDGNSPGDTGGSTAFTISGNTSNDGFHHGSATLRVRQSAGGAGSGAFANNEDIAPSHPHSFSKSGTFTPLYRRVTLIEKTGAPGEIPVNGGVFADGQLIAAALAAVTTYVGRLVTSGTPGVGGTASPFYLYVNLDPAGAHGHRSDEEAADGTPGFGDPKQYVDAPDHNHGGRNYLVTANIKRMKLAHYVATVGAPIVPGAIILYVGTDPLPSGWYLCDGQNGTPDLRDRFIEISTPSAAGELTGDNTLRMTGTTYSDGEHDHEGDDAGSGNHTLAKHDNVTGAHTHDIDVSAPYEPPFYVIKFIQYTGV